MRTFHKPFIGLVVFGMMLFSVLSSSNARLDAQETALPKPSVTPVKGGYFVQWPTLTSIEAVQIPGKMTGRFEVVFDIRKEDIDKQPVAPDNPDILLPLADYWIVRGKPERAIPLYEKGLEKEPENFTFQNNLAILLSSAKGQHDEALDIIDNALESKLDNITLLDTKGLILLNADRPDEAVPVLERAVTLSCQGPIYMLHLSQALDMDGRKDSARNWFEKTRPFLEGPEIKLSKENQEMFDNLKMKYSGPTE